MNPDVNVGLAKEPTLSNRPGLPAARKPRVDKTDRCGSLCPQCRGRCITKAYHDGAHVCVKKGCPSEDGFGNFVATWNGVPLRTYMQALRGYAP